ncbi:MAG: hypothetical protein EZS28_037753, partial [Streblomastix strix]
RNMDEEEQPETTSGEEWDFLGGRGEKGEQLFKECLLNVGLTGQSIQGIIDRWHGSQKRHACFLPIFAQYWAYQQLTILKLPTLERLYLTIANYIIYLNPLESDGSKCYKRDKVLEAESTNNGRSIKGGITNQTYQLRRDRNSRKDHEETTRTSREDFKGCLRLNLMPNQLDIEMVGEKRCEERVEERVDLTKQKDKEDALSLNQIQINREARISKRDAAEPDAIVTPLGPINASNDNNSNDNQRNDYNNINNQNDQHNNSDEIDKNYNNNKQFSSNEDAINKQSNSNDDTDNKQRMGNDDANNNNNDKIDDSQITNNTTLLQISETIRPLSAFMSKQTGQLALSTGCET